MADDIMQRHADWLRRAYSPQPGMGLNGTTRQSLTEPQQLDRLLSGMGEVITNASNELHGRETREPGTFVGMGRTGPDQRARLRQLNRIPVQSRRRLSPTAARQNGNGNNGNGRVSPSGMPGRRNWQGAGRPRKRT